MKSTKLTNRIISLNNRRTSMRLSIKEWEALKEICHKEKITRNKLIEMIEQYKDNELGLSYSTRLFITCYYWHAATDTGHRLAGHGVNDNHISISNSIKALFNS